MIDIKNLKTHRFTPALLLMACAYLLFAPTFKSPWLMDDVMVILQNPAILSLDAFLHKSNFLRPLREVSLLVDHALFGFDSAGYHIQQIFWHGLNCVLIFHLAVRLGLSRRAAWISALLFLAHPVHVEVVANISHRKDSISLAFALMALLAYINSFSAAKEGLWRFVSLICCVLGFLAKGNVLVMPLIMWLYETCFIPRDDRILARHNRYGIRFACAGAAALGLWCILLWNSGRFIASINDIEILKVAKHGVVTPNDYFLMVVKSFAFMAWKLVWPAKLSMEYSYAIPGSWFDPWIVAAAALTASLSFLMTRWFRSSKILFFSMGWLIVFWIPTSNIFWHFSYFAADRYLYAPSVGLCLLVPVLLEKLSRPPALAVAVGLVLVTASAGLTWRQNMIWSDQGAFYRNMLEVSPDCKNAVIGLSNHYMEQGKPAEALALLERPLKGDPATMDPDYYYQAGLLHSALGKRSEAVSFFRKAVSKAGSNPEYLISLGTELDQSGASKEAVQILETVAANLPNHPVAKYDLGVCYIHEGRYREAEDAFLAAVSLNPTDAKSLYNAVVVQKKLGKADSARETLAKLRQVDPRLADELNR